MAPFVRDLYEKYNMDDELGLLRRKLAYKMKEAIMNNDIETLLGKTEEIEKSGFLPIAHSISDSGLCPRFVLLSLFKVGDGTEKDFKNITGVPLPDEKSVSYLNSNQITDWYWDYIFGYKQRKIDDLMEAAYLQKKSIIDIDGEIYILSDYEVKQERKEEYEVFEEVRNEWL